MNITRGITVSVVSAGLAVAGFASPASADDAAPKVVQTYAFNLVGGTEPTTWTVTQCGVKCVHVADSGNGTTEPWESDAYLLRGHWTMFVDRQDIVTCPDGMKYPAMAQYNWDASLKGIVSASTNGVCGGPPEPIQESFTLKWIS